LKHQTEGEIIAFIFMNFINALNIDDEIWLIISKIHHQVLMNFFIYFRNQFEYLQFNATYLYG
jgi:hypothetical protein